MAGSRYKDLRGKTFGELTVLDQDPVIKKSGTKSVAYWNCRCSCGKEKLIISTSLVSGTTKTCGHSRMKDLTGKKFGRLTVLRKADGFCRDNPKWICQCVCGNTLPVNHYSLLAGTSQSCGCSFQDAIHVALEADKMEPETRIGSLTRGKPSNNTSGVKGVYFNKKTGKWIAEIKFKGVKHHLGSFSDLKEAAKARKKAEEEYFDPVLEKHGRKKQEEK